MNQPDGMNIKLFPHQLQSVYDMEKLENEKKIKIKDEDDREYHIETRMGVLGDIPGYGKSFSVIGLISNDKMEWDESYYLQIPRCVTNGLKVIETIEYKTIDTTLLVANTSIIPQWEEYFGYSDLAIKSITTKKQASDIDPNRYNVIIISPQRFNEFVSRFEEYAWKRLIFDEPTAVHIPKMTTIQAGFYWFITATYNALIQMVYTHRHFLRDMFSCMGRDIFHRIIVKNPDDFVKSSFKMPETHFKEYKCINPAIIGVIQNAVEPHILEMINAGDIKGAAEALGCTKSDTKNLVEVVKNKKKHILKEAELKIELYKNDSKYKKELENWIKRREEIQKVISDLEEKFKNCLKGECPICRCDLESPVMTPCCNQIFCGGCVFEWLKKNTTCPLCRSCLRQKDVIYVNEGEESDEKKSITQEIKDDSPKSKPDTIVKIIKSNIKKENSRFIIFSSYDESFYQIRKALDEAKINCIEIKGTKEVKTKRLSKYKSGEEKVIFLNSHYNGAGINLEMTTDIILYHEMNNDLKTQIIGRANRMGRKYDLSVHTLI
jgi:hypothetical protein